MCWWLRFLLKIFYLFLMLSKYFFPLLNHLLQLFLMLFPLLIHFFKMHQKIEGFEFVTCGKMHSFVFFSWVTCAMNLIPQELTLFPFFLIFFAPREHFSMLVQFSISWLIRCLPRSFWCDSWNECFLPRCWSPLAANCRTHWYLHSCLLLWILLSLHCIWKSKLKW